MNYYVWYYILLKLNEHMNRMYGIKIELLGCII